MDIYKYLIVGIIIGFVVGLSLGNGMNRPKF